MVSQRDSLYNTGMTLNKSISGSGGGGLTAFQPRTLSDWLATTSGSQRTAQYGYFGPGALLRKDITTAGDTTIASDFFTNTFGAKVWDSLNSQTRAFNLIRKVAWGNTTGWRIRSGRNTSTRGISETATLPSIDTPDLQTVSVHPSFIVTSLGVSALSQFLATLEGGLGDALAVAQEAAEVDHLKKINQMLLAPSELRVTANSAGVAGARTAQLVDDASEYVSVGDVFTGTTASSEVVITELSDTGAITYVGGALVEDEILYARDRAGIWSLSDIINYAGRTVNGVSLGAGNSAAYGNLGSAMTPTGTARTAGGWNAAGYINGNLGNLRHLTTGSLDRVIQQVRINGFQPDLLLTGLEQEVRLGTILQANQHFVGEGRFQVKQGGEATLPGYETGFEVSTYKRIPLFTDPDMTPVWQLAGNGNEKRGTDVFVMDTRFLEMPVLFTTQYMESRDYIHNNMLGIKAIFLTSANIRCLNFRAQGRVTDLSDGVNLS